MDLSNPIYQGIGAIFGLAAIILSLIFWWTDRQRRELSYQVVSNTPLISVKEEEELKGRLEVMFDKQAAQNLNLNSVIVKVINSGNVPIGEDDYYGHPIEFRFGENAEVLTASVVKTEPVDFDAKAEPSGTKALLQPVLFNKGQSITIKMLVKQGAKFQVYAHIKGIDSVKIYIESRTSASLIKSVLLILSLPLLLILEKLFGAKVDVLSTLIASVIFMIILLLLDWTVNRISGFLNGSNRKKI